MAEQENTEAQLKAKGVHLLLEMRLTAAQNLLESTRQDHEEQCRLVLLDAGADVETLEKRMHEIERRILTMQPLLTYAEERVREAEMASKESELPASSPGSIRDSSIRLTQKVEDANLELAQRHPYAEPGQFRELHEGSL